MIAIGVIDVGSPAKGKLGWAILRPNHEAQTGRDLDSFIAEMTDACAHWPAAIGFEAPLFAPMRTAARQILAARSGEGSRPWSAAAGATVTTTALAVVSYSLARLRTGLAEAVGGADWTARPSKPGEVLFFEAFVTKADKEGGHEGDALIAARAAAKLFDTEPPWISAIDENDVFSLLGAAMLRTGWTTDLAALSLPCLVVRPGV